MNDPLKVKAGQASKKVSPWGQAPHCMGKSADRAFAKGRRLFLIRDIARKMAKEKE